MVLKVDGRLAGRQDRVAILLDLNQTAPRHQCQSESAAMTTRHENEPVFRIQQRTLVPVWPHGNMLKPNMKERPATEVVLSQHLSSSN